MKALRFVGVAAVGLLAGSAMADMGGTTSNGSVTISNLVTVTSPYYVGDYGTNNQLFVDAGGTLELNTGWEGMFIGRRSGADYNQAFVGTGGAITSSGNQRIMIGGRANATGGDYNELHVGGGVVDVGRIEVGGGDSVGNVLRIDNQGSVTLRDNYLRLHGAESKVYVEGDGSKLTTDQLYMGYGNNHLLDISGGAEAVVGGDFRVGYSAAATNGRVVVSSGGTLETRDQFYVGGVVGSRHNEVRIADGGTLLLDTGFDGLLVGRYDGADHNRLVVETGGLVEGRNTDLIHIGGYLGADGGNSNVVHVQGGTMTNVRFAIGGATGQHNALRVTDGGKVYASSYVRLYGSANEVVVEGNGSLLDTPAGQPFRLYGDNNLLTVSNQGQVVVRNNLVAGYDAGGTNNRVAVSSGGTLETRGSLEVGGFERGSTHNEVHIADDGTLLLNLGYDAMYVGRDSDHNLVKVEQGGMIQGLHGLDMIHIGGRLSGDGGNHNEVHVQGGTITNVRFAIGGATGQHNALRVTGGGKVYGHTYLRLSSSENQVVVQGNDSLLAMKDEVQIYGSNNLLDISDNGRMATEGDFFLGYAAGDTGNRVVVKDDGRFEAAGSVWVGYDGSGNSLIVDGSGAAADMPGTLFIGLAGNENKVTVTNAGELSVNVFRIGQVAGDGNALLVTGGGSLFTATGNARVGVGGSDSLLTVEAGGRAVLDEVEIGVNAGADNNAILVAGSGSSLAAGDMAVGAGGSQSRVTVQQGATVGSGNVAIGYAAGSQDNQVLITGGAAWTNTGVFFVGLNEESGNLLQVHDGALLETDRLEVGAGGTLELSNATVVAEAATNPFVVQDGGLLRGSGRIETDMTLDAFAFIDGTVSPGFSTGTLTFEGDLILGENAVVVMEIAGLSDYDRIVQEGWGFAALTFGGTLKLSLLDGYQPDLHDSYQLFTADSYLDIEKMEIDGTDAGLPAGWSWQLNDDGSVSVIPEAATTGTMLIGLALIFAYRRRGA